MKYKIADETNIRNTQECRIEFSCTWTLRLGGETRCLGGANNQAA